MGTCYFGLIFILFLFNYCCEKGGKGAVLSHIGHEGLIETSPAVATEVMAGLFSLHGLIPWCGMRQATVCPDWVKVWGQMVSQITRSEF